MAIAPPPTPLEPSGSAGEDAVLLGGELLLGQDSLLLEPPSFWSCASMSLSGAETAGGGVRRTGLGVLRRRGRAYCGWAYCGSLYADWSFCDQRLA